MDEQLTTYQDWVAFAHAVDGRCSKSIAATFAAGTFEPPAVGRVYQLICEYCVSCLDALDDALFARLKSLDVQDAYGVFLVCSRFCDACDNLLFFRDVNGIPVDWKNALEEDILRNMSGALGHVRATGPAAASDDAAYYLHSLQERRCRKK